MKNEIANIKLTVLEETTIIKPFESADRDLNDWCCCKKYAALKVW